MDSHVLTCGRPDPSFIYSYNVIVGRKRLINCLKSEPNFSMLFFFTSVNISKMSSAKMLFPACRALSTHIIQKHSVDITDIEADGLFQISAFVDYHVIFLLSFGFFVYNFDLLHWILILRMWLVLILTGNN